MECCNYVFSLQQSNGSVQAHGTGVYEDLPCGLVSDLQLQLSRFNVGCKDLMADQDSFLPVVHFQTQ